jgi:hypothetical protein
MNRTIKRTLIWVVSIIGIGFISYVGFVIYVLNLYAQGCGNNDGPFKAVLIKQCNISDSSQVYQLSGNGKLILENRNDTLSPLITLVENGKVKWTLDTDVRNTKDYKKCRIWKISDLVIMNNSDPIQLSFTADWSFGAERGTMEINRSNGDNSFCLSW